jgi:hypothetical protein
MMKVTAVRPTKVSDRVNRRFAALTIKSRGDGPLPVPAAIGLLLLPQQYSKVTW